MSNYKLYSASLLSGILLILIFPGFNFEILAWVSLVPLFIATRKTSPLTSLKLGFITGFVFYIGVIYWIVIAMTKYGSIPMAIGIAVLILLSGYLAIYLSLFTFLLSYFCNQQSAKIYISTIFMGYFRAYQGAFFNRFSVGKPWLFSI